MLTAFFTTDTLKTTSNIPYVDNFYTTATLKATGNCGTLTTISCRHTKHCDTKITCNTGLL